MGTSFVRIGEHGFWMQDSTLELWLRLLALHLEDPAEEGSVCERIRAQWLLASRGYFNGCVPLRLEEDVSTDEGRELVLTAIQSMLAALRKAPATLSGDVLNLMGMEGIFHGDCQTAALIEVGHAFIDLIEGRVSSDASDTSFMPGSS